MIKPAKYNRSKGVALIIILVLITAIVVVALGFIVRGDTELLCGENMELKADMDYLAESGLEHAKGLIMYPHDLPGEPNRYSAQQLYTGPDYYDVNVTKVSDCNWRITSLAYRQASGSRTAQSSLTANLRLDPAVAFWSDADVTLSPYMSINGDVYCNGVLANSGTINGDCFANSIVGNGITGSKGPRTDLQLNRPAINSSILTTNFPTQAIIPSSLINDTKSDTTTQIYYRSGDFEIKSNVIINGCLAVDGNLTISGTGNVITAKKNVPAVYVSGDFIMKDGSALDCNGLVFVDGRIHMPICNRALNVTGALFTDEGMQHIVPDYSIYGKHGIVHGNCAWVAGIVGGAINFDGDGDYIEIGSLPVAITNRFTVSARIKVTAFDKSYQAIVTKGDTSWRLQREGSTNKIQFACNLVSGSVAVAYMNGSGINYGQWYHVAGVYDGIGGIITLYLDGVPFSTYGVTGIVKANSFPVYIGENAEASGRYFNGVVDQVRIYNRVLTQEEIQAIGSQTSSLVGYWPMDWGNCSTTVNAAPVKAAIYDWPGGVKNRWSPAAGAFYKSITRNP